MIAHAEVYLGCRENVDGIFFIQSVISYDQDGKEIENSISKDMADYEFHDKDEVINEVSQRLNLAPTQVDIKNIECFDTQWDD